MGNRASEAGGGGGPSGISGAEAGAVLDHDKHIVFEVLDGRDHENRKLISEMDRQRSTENRNACARRLELLEEFISQQHVTARKLKHCLKRYDVIFDTRHENLNYVDFCSVMHVELLYAKCEELFRFYSFIVDDPRTGDRGPRIYMKEFLSSLMALVEAPLDDKLTFIYGLWDPHETGLLERKDLAALLQACHCVNDVSEVAPLVRSLMSCAQDPSSGISKRELYDAIHSVPEMVFPRPPPSAAGSSAHK